MQMYQETETRYRCTGVIAVGVAEHCGSGMHKDMRWTASWQFETSVKKAAAQQLGSGPRNRQVEVEADKIGLDSCGLA